MLRQATEGVMHDFEPDQQLIQRRTVTAGEPTEATKNASLPPKAPRAVHGEASLLHLQRTAGNASVVQMLADEKAEEQAQGASPVHDVIGRGGGAPLDGALRGTMESQFGQDFGDVRVHTDAQASASAESVGANAYTVGNDIVFKSGEFDASSASGQRTVAHELSHVVQQRSGPVDGADAPGGIRVSDPGDRFERAADATADQVMAGSSASTGAGPAAPSLQLEPEDETEVPVQRQAAMEDEEDQEEAATA
jgi:hypothetical protein